MLEYKKNVWIQSASFGKQKFLVDRIPRTSHKLQKNKLMLFKKKTEEKEKEKEEKVFTFE